MKNFNRRIAIFLLCLTIVINIFGQKKEVEVDMISYVDGNIRQSTLEEVLKDNLKSIKDLGINGVLKLDDNVLKLDDNEIKKILELSENLECQYTYNVTVDEIINTIKKNSEEGASLHPDLEYTSFFDDNYYQNLQVNFPPTVSISELYYDTPNNQETSSSHDENLMLIKDAAYNALYSYIGYVLSTGTSEDIHQFLDLKIEFVSDIASNHKDAIVKGQYNYSSNTITICMPNIINNNYSINSLLADLDETIKHELNHVRQYACSDSFESGKQSNIDFLNGYNNSFLIEASAESSLYNLGIESGYEKTAEYFNYTYEEYRELENKLLLCSLFNNYEITDYYAAINNEDINSLLTFLGANTYEEKEEIFKIIYTMDALEGKNDYIYNELGDKEEYTKEDIFKIYDKVNNLHYISIFKLAVSNLINYNIKNSDLTLEDNIILYYFIANNIAEGAFIVDDTYKNEDIYYCYDEFCEQYKKIEDTFFNVLSIIYRKDIDEIKEIYKKHQYSNIKKIIINYSNGVYDDLDGNDNILFYFDRLLTKFPKIKEIIFNSYLYTNLDNSENLEMLNDVSESRILIRKIQKEDIKY